MPSIVAGTALEFHDQRGPSHAGCADRAAGGVAGRITLDCPAAAAQLRANWRLQETSGTAAVDTSPLSNNGTYTGGVLRANSTAVPTNGAIAANFGGVKIIKWVEIQ